MNRWLKRGIYEQVAQLQFKSLLNPTWNTHLTEEKYDIFNKIRKMFLYEA